MSLQKEALEFDPSAVRVVTILAFGEEQDETQNFFRANNIGLETFVNREAMLEEKWGLGYQTPVTVVLDAERTVLSIIEGSLDPVALAEIFGREPPVVESPSREIREQPSPVVMPPAKRPSRRVFHISGLVTLAAIGFGTYSHFQAEDAYQNYLDATTSSVGSASREDAENFDRYTLYSGIAAGVAGVLTYFSYKAYRRASQQSALRVTMHVPDSHTVGVIVGKTF